MAKFGVEKGDNFWPKSKVIALHLDPKFTGNKSGQNLWQKLVLKKGANFWPKSKVIALHFDSKFTGNKNGQNLW